MAGITSLLRSLAVRLAKWTPPFLKKWLHGNRWFDRLSRRLFASLVGMNADRVAVESGPLRGLFLAVGEHISHAHISGTYEIEVQQAIERLPLDGRVCYDLGASIGYLSLLMARRACCVYAFEPAPHAAQQVARNAAANGFDHITVVPDPVSDCRKPVSFSITDVAYGSRIVNGETEWPVLELTTITLDDFAATHPAPDFIKIDVEGEEARVLEGARTLLRDNKPIICCELHSDAAARQVCSILAEYDYRLTTLDSRPFHLSSPVVPGEVHILAFPQ